MPDLIRVAGQPVDGNDGRIGKLDYPIGNKTYGQRVFLSGTEVPVETFSTLRVSYISRTPTITAGAYSANDAVGGLMTFAYAGASGATPDQGVILDSVIVTDLTTQNAALELWLFDQGFTATADNGAFTIIDTDMINFVAIVPISTYYNAADNSVAFARNLGIPLPLASPAAALYGQLVTRGTPTYASTSDLRITLGIVKG